MITKYRSSEAGTQRMMNSSASLSGQKMPMRIKDKSRSAFSFSLGRRNSKSRNAMKNQRREITRNPSTEGRRHHLLGSTSTESGTPESRTAGELSGKGSRKRGRTDLTSKLKSRATALDLSVDLTLDPETLVSEDSAESLDLVTLNTAALDSTLVPVDENVVLDESPLHSHMQRHLNSQLGHFMDQCELFRREGISSEHRNQIGTAILRKYMAGILHSREIHTSIKSTVSERQRDEVITQSLSTVTIVRSKQGERVVFASLLRLAKEAIQAIQAIKHREDLPRDLFDDACAQITAHSREAPKQSEMIELIGTELLTDVSVDELIIH